MSSRPAIPAEIEREVLIESGHRCAVCGTPCPLERAHIVPWHKSKEHKAEDLICLCANCHERADREKWGQSTLRQYKRMPWVLRRYEDAGDVSQPATIANVVIKVELDDAEKGILRLLRYAIAGFLEISPHAVQITEIDRSQEIQQRECSTEV
jgi:type I restriction enzyme R subunit